MDIQDVARALRHGWWLPVAGALAGLAVALAVVASVAPRYSSSVELTVSPVSWSGAESAYEGDLYSQNRVTSYARLLSSTGLASRVVSDLGLDTTPQALARTVTAVVLPKTSVIEVTVTAASAAGAKDTAEALNREFTRWVTQAETGGAGSSLVRVTTAQAPAAEPTAVSPQTDRDIALGGAVGLVAGLAAAVVAHRTRGRVTTGDDVLDLTHIPLLGVVDPTGTPYPRTALADVAGRLLEAAGTGEQAGPLVAVIGTAGDGAASTVATALGQSFTSLGAHVTLVDGAPDADRAEPPGPDPWSPGTAPARAGDAVPGVPALVPEEAGGTTEPATAPGSGTRLAELRRNRGAVVLIAGPVTASGGALGLAAVADACILTARHGTRARSDLASAADTVRAAGREVVGVVLVAAAPRPHVRSRRYRYAADAQRGGRTAAPAALPAPPPGSGARRMTEGGRPPRV